MAINFQFIRPWTICEFRVNKAQLIRDMMMQTKIFRPKAFIFREFETAQEAFIIKSGLVEMTQTITHDGEEKQKIIAVLGPGEMFGEMALIDHELRIATARAKNEEVTLQIISQQQFDIVLRDTNPFVKKMLEIEIGRLRSKKI